jgi:hypothetical protein
MYVALFEPPPPAGLTQSRKFRQAPRPYILNPPLTNRQAFYLNDTLAFDLTLIGPAIEALPYFVYIFDKIGDRGLGPEKGKFKLIKVDLLKNEQACTIFDGSRKTFTAFLPETGPTSDATDTQVTSVTLKFLTPLRIKEKGRLVTELTSHLFIERMMQRLHLLASFYGNHRGNSQGSALSAFHGHELLPLAYHLTMTGLGLHWYDWERTSQRQQTKMSFGGLRGSCTLQGKLTPLLPYLRLAEQVNLGQGTSFGLGRIRLEY